MDLCRSLLCRCNHCVSKQFCADNWVFLTIGYTGICTTVTHGSYSKYHRKRCQIQRESCFRILLRLQDHTRSIVEALVLTFYSSPAARRFKPIQPPRRHGLRCRFKFKFAPRSVSPRPATLGWLCGSDKSNLKGTRGHGHQRTAPADTHGTRPDPDPGLGSAGRAASRPGRASKHEGGGRGPARAQPLHLVHLLDHLRRRRLPVQRPGSRPPPPAATHPSRAPPRTTSPRRRARTAGSHRPAPRRKQTPRRRGH